MTQAKKKALAGSVAKATTVKSPTASRRKVAAKTKTVTAKPTEVEKLKLQIKKLRASLKETITENELQKKQIASLTRKNTNLSKKLAAEPSKLKTIAKAKPISLSLPKQEKKPLAKSKRQSKRNTSRSENEGWVDKWWETF